MPPFPRADNPKEASSEPEAPRPIHTGDGFEASDALPEAGTPVNPERTEPTASPSDSTFQGVTHRTEDAVDRSDSHGSPFQDIPPQEPDLVTDHPATDGADIDNEATEPTRARADYRSFRSLAMNELSRRGELALLQGMERIADSCDDTAHRIQRLAALRGGPEATSFGPVRSTIGGLEGAADYLRNTDLEGIQKDLRRRVRARPIQTLGIALCVGWVTGRILR